MKFRRVVQVLSAALVVAAGAVFVIGFIQPETEVLDHHNYQVAIDGMRAGQSYYAAYDVGFREVYGPIPSTRDIRLPTVYAALALLPAGSEHVAFAVMAVAAGLVTVAVAEVALSGVLVTLYLLTLAVADNGAAQYLYAEFWVVPLAIAAVLALDRERDLAALVLGVATFAVREQGIVLLGGIALYLWVQRRHRLLAASSLALAAGGYLAHASATQPYLDPVGGVHTPLHLGWGPLESLIRTVEFGFDLPLLGAALIAGALLWAKRHRLLIAVGPFLALPLLNLWVNRPYWGSVVIPLAIVLAVDVPWESYVRRTSARPAPVQTAV